MLVPWPPSNENGASEQADQGVQPQGCGHGYAREILQKHESNSHRHKNQEGDTACPEGS